MVKIEARLVSSIERAEAGVGECVIINTLSAHQDSVLINHPHFTLHYRSITRTERYFGHQPTAKDLTLSSWFQRLKPPSEDEETSEHDESESEDEKTSEHQEPGLESKEASESYRTDDDSMIENE